MAVKRHKWLGVSAIAAVLAAVALQIPAHAGDCGGSGCSQSPGQTVNETSTIVPVTSQGSTRGEYSNTNTGAMVFNQINQGPPIPNAVIQGYFSGGWNQMVLQCGQSQFTAGVYPTLSNERLSLSGQLGYTSNNAPFNCGDLAEQLRCYQAWDLNSKFGGTIAESELSKRCLTKFGVNIRSIVRPPAPQVVQAPPQAPIAPATPMPAVVPVPAKF
jgi:hypothetical protein